MLTIMQAACKRQMSSVLQKLRNVRSLQELKEMRQAGVRTFEDAEEYEAEKRKHTAEPGKSGEWPHRPSLQVGMEDTSMAAQVICCPYHSPFTVVFTCAFSRLPALLKQAGQVIP